MMAPFVEPSRLQRATPFVRQSSRRPSLFVLFSAIRQQVGGGSEGGDPSSRESSPSYTVQSDAYRFRNYEHLTISRHNNILVV